MTKCSHAQIETLILLLSSSSSPTLPLPISWILTMKFVPNRLHRAYAPNQCIFCLLDQHRINSRALHKHCTPITQIHPLPYHSDDCLAARESSLETRADYKLLQARLVFWRNAATSCRFCMQLFLHSFVFYGTTELTILPFMAPLFAHYSYNKSKGCVRMYGFGLLVQ